MARFAFLALAVASAACASAGRDARPISMGAAASSDRSLVGYWKLDEKEGITAADASGGAHPGTLANGALISLAVAPVRFANARCVSFDGVDDSISVGTSPSFTNIRMLTVAAWISPNSAGQQGLGRVVNKRIKAGWTVFVYDGQLRFRQTFSGKEGLWHTATGTLAYGVWQHVAVTFDAASAGNDPVLYINGVTMPVTEAETPAGTAVDDTAAPLHIGNVPTGDRTFDGLIDDVRVYNRVLSPAEIKALF